MHSLKLYMLSAFWQEVSGRNYTYACCMPPEPCLLLIVLCVLQVMQGMRMGALRLPASGTQTVDACFKLINDPPGSKPVFSSFASLRLTKRAIATGPDQRSPSPAADAASVSTDQGHIRSAPKEPAVQSTSAVPRQAVQSAGSTSQAVQHASRLRLAAGAQEHRTAAIHNLAGDHHSDALPTVGNGVDYTEALTPNPSQGMHVAQPAAELDLADQYNWLTQELPKQSLARLSGSSSTHVHASLAAAAAASWEQLRLNYALPQGQGVFESLWSPYDTEDLAGCPDCQPLI
jgi:hypothetical protein